MAEQSADKKINIFSDNSLGLDEVAKTLRPAAETGARLFENLFTNPSRQLGRLVSEQIEAWRFSNRMRIGQGLVSKCKIAGVDPAAIPPAFILPAIEAAQDVEDPGLQEMWQNLLSNAAASSDAQQAMFIQTLKLLSPRDATAFNAFVASQPFPAGSEGALTRLEALLLLTNDFTGERIDRRSGQSRRIYTIIDDRGEKHRTFLDPPVTGQVQNDRVVIRRTGLRLSDYGRQFYRVVAMNPITNTEISAAPNPPETSDTPNSSGS